MFCMYVLLYYISTINIIKYLYNVWINQSIAEVGTYPLKLIYTTIIIWQYI